jgi:hypothetical protein
MTRDPRENTSSGFLWRWRSRRIAADPERRQHRRPRTDPPLAIGTDSERALPETGDE